MDTFTARSPLDLLALVPFVIGFHPTESVVVLTMGASPDPAPQDRPASFHARVDLPLDPETRREVVLMLRSVIARQRADLAGIVVYTADKAAAAEFAAVMVDGLDEDDVEVIDAIRVEGDRFFPADDPGHEGIRFDLSTHPFTARGVLEGRVIHADREALRESLVGTDPEDVEQISAAATRTLATLTRAGMTGDSVAELLGDQSLWMEDWISDHLGDQEPIDVETAAQLLVLVSFEAVREVAWASMTRAEARAQVELWRTLVRRAPADLIAGASGLLAFAAWLAGDGALAWCAIDRSLEYSPEDRLALHVAALIRSATPPTAWTPVPVRTLRLHQMTKSS